MITLTPNGGRWAVEATAYLDDRPGALAELARTAAMHGANITRFVFNRAESPNRVRLTAEVRRAMRAGALVEHLDGQGLLLPREEAASEVMPDPDAILTLKVRLVDQPGTLAEFAELLAAHRANVIFMQYDRAVAPGQCEMSMVAPSAQEAGSLLTDLTEAKYDFHVEYRGSDPDAYHAIIGLSAAEVFFLRLRESLPEAAQRELRELVAQSEQLQRSLVGFRRESARSEASMAAGEVFENVLELATMSLRKLGPHFALKCIGPLRVSEAVSLYALSPPTGCACYLLDDGADLTAIDTGFGLYYDDWKAWIGRLGLDAARIRRVFLTHPDADHAGFAGALQEEFGAEVLGHPDARRVFEAGNRAAGSPTALKVLNEHFTRLVNAFTRAHYPAQITGLQPLEGERGGFPRREGFQVGEVGFEVLESLGGHTPGQVFYLAPEHGLLFSGDYLIDFGSLSDHDKARLSVPKCLMVSTNVDSRVFGEEMARLQELMVGLQERLAREGRHARVLPGHGDPYLVEEACSAGIWPRG
ncbi:MAG: MBL fold metallo-hydrolase [Armatimonadetes bacterium]|nr:MBL fold metallo-hydrolase [Armatimonadota bacterium]